MSRNDRLVYSSEQGNSLCPRCRKPPRRCKCAEKVAAKAAATTAKQSQFVYVARDSKGRKGKTVTVVSGLPLTGPDLKQVATDLKRRCGTGGAIKDGNVEIQGDQRDILVAELEALGYKVKRKGG